jgi:hypothetical protein
VTARRKPRSGREGAADGGFPEKILTNSSRAGYSHVLMIEEAHDLTVTTLKYLNGLEDGYKKLPYWSGRLK